PQALGRVVARFLLGGALVVAWREGNEEAQPLPPPEVAQARVPRDLEEPRLEALGLTELPDRSGNLEEDRLSQVVDSVSLASHAEYESSHALLVEDDELGQGLFAAGDRVFDRGRGGHAGVVVPEHASSQSDKTHAARKNRAAIEKNRKGSGPFFSSRMLPMA